MMQEKQQVRRITGEQVRFQTETGAPHLRMETDPVSETLLPLVFIIEDDGQPKPPAILRETFP
jgi:hypothetical protein